MSDISIHARSHSSLDNMLLQTMGLDTHQWTSKKKLNFPMGINLDWSAIQNRVETHPYEANVDIPEFMGWKPLHVALNNATVDPVSVCVLKSLIQACPESVDTFAIQIACQNHHNSSEILEKLLEAKPSLARDKDDYGCLPIHHAASAGNYNATKILSNCYRQGLFMKDSCGMLPLHHACWQPYLDSDNLALHKCVDTLHLILEEISMGSPLQLIDALDTRDTFGMNPIEYATSGFLLSTSLKGRYDPNKNSLKLLIICIKAQIASQFKIQNFSEFPVAHATIFFISNNTKNTSCEVKEQLGIEYRLIMKSVLAFGRDSEAVIRKLAKTNSVHPLHLAMTCGLTNENGLGEMMDYYSVLLEGDDFVSSLLEEANVRQNSKTASDVSSFLLKQAHTIHNIAEAPELSKKAKPNESYINRTKKKRTFFACCKKLSS